MHRNQRRFIVLAAASAGVLSLAGRSALAATETWDNGGGDQLWSNNTNWNPDADVTGNDAKFTTATGTTSNTTVTNIVNASKSLNSLGYNQFGTSSAATVYHITQINDGQTLTVSGSTGANGSAIYAGSGVAAGGASDFSYTFLQNQPSA